MKTILCSVPFFFRRIDSSFIEPTSLYASIAVNKAAKRAQIKFRLQPSFYDKALQSYKKNRTFVTSFNPITQFTNERICK